MSAKADVKRLSIGQLIFFGPPCTGNARREWKPEEIIRSASDRSQTGPFGDMPLEDADQLQIIADSFNDNAFVKLDGSERVDGICKEIANRIFREWFVRNPAPTEGKWSPIIMVSIHQQEPPQALSGDHYHKYKNEAERWAAYEFKLPDCGLYILVKFGV